jgi:hypothetical protein
MSPHTLENEKSYDWEMVINGVPQVIFGQVDGTL